VAAAAAAADDDVVVIMMLVKPRSHRTLHAGNESRLCGVSVASIPLESPGSNPHRISRGFSVAWNLTKIRLKIKHSTGQEDFGFCGVV